MEHAPAGTIATPPGPDRERELKLLALSREQLEAVGRQEQLAGLPLRPLDTRRQDDVYVDTEDFRLFRAGLALRYRHREDTVRATLKQVLQDTDRPLLAERGELEHDVDPAQLDESVVATGPIRERVAPLLGTRRLAPVVRIRTHRRRCLLGGADSALAELCLDRVEVFGPRGESPVAGFFEVELEDRGAGSDLLDAAGRELLARHGLLPSTLSKLERGLAALGRLDEVRGDDERHDVVVRLGDRLVDAAYRVFRKHFERMKRNEPGTRLGVDPEFLHDMRVSTRRLRASFRTFREAVPPVRLEGFGRDLRWIASVLGEVRDLDVYLEALPGYGEELAEADRPGLEPVSGHLRRRRERARESMLRALESRRYAAFLDRFERFLRRGAPRRTALPAARELASQAAPRLIRRALKRVLRAGRAIPEVPAAESLHRLRILCKRLRYTCEFFVELYGKPMRRFIRKVVELQDLLGAHQDACVASETLRAFAGTLPAGRRDSVRTALAVGQLVAIKDRTGAALRSRFRDAWGRFDRKRVRRSMWGSTPPARGVGPAGADRARSAGP